MPAEQPTVLLLPGLLCDASVWPAQQAALQALAPVHVADYGDCSSIAAMAERADSVRAPLCHAEGSWSPEGRKPGSGDP